jgi:hypothetical protein
MKQRILLIVILFITGFIACNKNSDSSIPVTSSSINVFFAVPGRQFDVAIDTATIGTNLGAGESTGYHSFLAKRYNLYIFAAGNHQNAIAGGQISLRNNHYYSIFLSQDHNNNLRLLAAEDNLTPPAANKGNLRIVNLSDTYDAVPNQVTLDFFLGDTLRYQRISYQAVTSFIPVQAGSHIRDIRYADSSLSLRGNIDSNFVIEDHKIYSWIVYGNALVADSFKLATFVH